MKEPKDEEEQQDRQLWVLEGVLDVPVGLLNGIEDLDLARNPTVPIDFSGGTGDGFLQFKPVDWDRAVPGQWWSLSEPTRCSFRASVLADPEEFPLPRAANFLDHCLDWLTIIYGVLVRVSELRHVYNESECQLCREGLRESYRSVPVGTPTFRTRPPRNPFLATFPFDDTTRRALRWLRKGMMAENPEDRFLCFWIVCESLSRSIAEGDTRSVDCLKCKETYEIPAHPDHKGFKIIIERVVGEDDPKTYKKLNRLRGALFHGGKHPGQAIAEIENATALLWECALASLAAVIGVERSQIRMLYPTDVSVFPLCEIRHADLDPGDGWGDPPLEAIRKQSEGR